MPFILNLLRGRLLALLPFLFPFFKRQKKWLFIGGAVIIAWPIIKSFLESSEAPPNDKGKLRKHKEYYRNIAQLAHELMNGQTSDKEEEDIVELFEDLNKDELIEVYNQFGKKRYGVNGDPAFIPWLYPEKSLIGWLQEEIEKDDLEYLRELFKETGLWP